MTILLLCNKFPYPSTDGSSIAIMKMLDTLLAGGNQMHLFSLNTKKHYKDPQKFKDVYGKKVKLTSVDIVTDITASNTAINLISGQPFHVSRFFASNVSDALNQVLKDETFDIVQFEGIFMGPYLDLVREKSNAKCVLRPHNVEYKIWERFVRSENNVLKSIYLQIQTKRLKKYEEEIIPQFDALLPISETDESFFKDYTNSPTLALPCATDLNNYPEFPSESSTFFHLGAMDWMPNVSGMEWFLDKVWPLVLKELPQAEFRLAGREMPKHLLEYKQKGITVYGEVESAETFYEENGVLIVPLLSGSGIRIKIIEGLSYGKAIVSTHIGAEGIAAKNNKQIFLEDSAEAFAKRMIELYLDKALRLSIGENARRFAAESFDVSVLGRKLNTFYTHLV